MYWALPALLCLTVGAASASAQAHAGVRAGVSAGPDQFFFGGHIESRPLTGRLTFRPNVEVGVGDGLTVLAINLEFIHSVPWPRHPWRLYFGAGPAALIYSEHDGRRGGDDGAGGGLNVVVGGQHRDGLLVELKVGLVDSPELKITVGYAFR